MSFNLIELLVVIAIIGILASLLLPALQRAQYAARLVGCVGNQRQIITALMTYTTDSNWEFPSHGYQRFMSVRIRHYAAEWGYDKSGNHVLGDAPNYQPMIAPYTGGTMNKLFLCPEVADMPAYRATSTSSWRDVDIDTAYNVPYSMYFNSCLGRSYTVHDKAMYRASQGFTVHSSGRTFTTLTSDYTQNGLYWNHVPPNVEKFQAGTHWSSTGNMWDWWNAPKGDGVYGKTDGSVVVYRDVTNNYAENFYFKDRFFFPLAHEER